MDKVLSIIIINTNSLDYLKKCISTVYASQLSFDFEVIVVDNYSGDGTDIFLRDEFPQVKYVKSTVNLGFTRGNNLGYAHSSGGFLLFLNPDTEILGDAMPLMVNTLENRPRAAIVGPKLLNSDGTLQTSCIQSFPTVLNQFVSSDISRRIFPRLSLWGTDAFFQHHDNPRQVEMVSGACLMMRREVFEEVGLFDIEYFIFAEDADLCYKAWQAGRDVLYQEGAVVIHHGGGATTKKGQSKFSDVLKRQSIRVFMRKHYGPVHSFLFVVSTSANAFIRLLILGFLLTLNVGFKWDVAGSFAKWKYILRWCLGLERWAGELNMPVEMTSNRWAYITSLRK
jgi:GT2 family glycosyltransferase